MNPEKAACIVDTVKGAALCRLPTLHNTLEMTERVVRDGIEGDFVECGVFAGAQVAVMSLTLQELGVRDRIFHLFDSFEGIPEAGPEDDTQPGIGPKRFGDGRLVSTGISVCSQEQVAQYLSQWGADALQMHYYEGWFQDTVPSWPGHPIALLRLDGDLYSSTRVCLRGLYPSLRSGGVLVIDDYALAGCRKAVDEYFSEIAEESPEFHTVEGGGGPVWMVKG
jgi:hypothetical protein